MVHYNQPTPMEYLTSKGIEFKRTNGQLQFQCTFNQTCHSDKHKGHMYMDEEEGLFDCKTCGIKGNLYQFMEHFGDKLQTPKIERKTKKQGKAKKNLVTRLEVEQCASELPERLRNWLIHQRGINEDVIIDKRIGYKEITKKGEIIPWITFPIQVEKGGYFMKLRKDPDDSINDEKGSVYPYGNSANLFGSENLENNSDYIVICEGELDQMVLESHGIPAITSTAGAGTFKEEWCEKFRGLKEIIVCLDHDGTGEKGMEKILKLMRKHCPGVKLFRIDLPEEVGEGGDITDFFVRLKFSVDDFMTLKTPYNAICKPRIAKLGSPDREVTIDSWCNTINSNFPTFLLPAKVALSTISQILIKDVCNPFAVILLDVPSAGKTITINFFDGIPELFYATDKFSAASFVSHSANTKKEDLEEIDLLPRLRYKMFLIRDFASIFSQREEDLKASLGILTRVLDGEGFQSESGVHGGRGYKGEYLFMILGASTPIPPRVWKIMGNLGSRLFFLNLNTPDKDEETLANQLRDKSFKVKESECKKATENYLKTLWGKYPNGVDWNPSLEDTRILKVIGRCAKLLARLRGVVNIWKEKGGDEEEFTYTTPVIEKPDRLNQLLYNLARGHAILFGRTKLEVVDLQIVIELTLDSADIMRSRLFQALLDNDGKLKTTDVERVLNCSKPTALKDMRTFEALGICKYVKNAGDIDGSEASIVVKDDLSWFFNDECNQIRNLN